MEYLETFSFDTLESFSENDRKKALLSLEQGKIIFLPKFSFPVSEEEKAFFSPDIVSPSSKNVSYNILKNTLGGVKPELENNPLLKALLNRYAYGTKKILDSLFPSYSHLAKQGRTSFRPTETEGRILSRKKDDTLLHVDAFPANPVKGERILRIFTNVNPLQKPRKWNVGESFERVVEKILPKVSAPFPFSASILKFFKVTKSLRSAYDHYMLQLHDAMKEDETYQNSVTKQEILFPAGSSWIVFTDQVSHAALSGQFLFEQTFYIPVHAQQNEELSPLRILERFLNKKLVCKQNA